MYRTHKFIELRSFKFQVGNSCHEKKLHTCSVFCYWQNACFVSVNLSECQLNLGTRYPICTNIKQLLSSPCYEAHLSASGITISVGFHYHPPLPLHSNSQVTYFAALPKSNSRSKFQVFFKAVSHYCSIYFLTK